MKKLSLLFLIGLVFFFSFIFSFEPSKAQNISLETKGQKSQQEQTEKITNLPLASMKIVNLSELAADEAAKGLPIEQHSESPFMKDPLDGKRQVPEDMRFPSENHPVKEPSFDLMVPSPTTSQSFQALPDNDTKIPPDTHGAAGPNHLMTVLNSQVRVQTKAGNTLSTVSLSSFWASVNPSNDVFDPKVLYDPYANRWMFTACATRRSPNSGVLIGVSQTSDPTGNWFLFNARADATGIDWADYPSMGFNKDWIVVSVNMFAVSNDLGNGTRTFVFRKNSLYNGTFNAGVFPRNGSEGFTIVPAITHSNTQPTVYLLSDWNGFSGLLRLYTITGSVGSEVYTATQTFPQAPGLSWQSGSPQNFAPQLGGSVGIMTNDSRMQNVVFRNDSLWATHTVFTPTSGTPTSSLVQWWQINPSNGSTTQVARIQESGRFFAYPSIAVNQNSDVLIGYSSFSANQFAAASYSFRAAADPLGTMRDSVALKAGEGCYYKTFGGGRNRWGDYSGTVVDPSNDTSFWTIQEYAAQSSPAGQCSDGSGRWGTWWGKIDPPGGNCIYDLNPDSRSFSAAGGSGFVDVITGSACSWTATVDAPSLLEYFSPFQEKDLFPLIADPLLNDQPATTQVTPETLFANLTPITINDRTSNTNPPGTGSLYPSTINVSGMTGTITKVDVALNNLSHSFPDDVDVLLVGPGGQRAILMSDVGGNPDVSGINLTFDQSAGALPDATQIVSGTYRPTNFNSNTTLEPGGIDNFPSPGPGQTTYTADLNVFNGTAPNGTWRLYVVDDEAVDVGNIATGWALGITTSGGGNSWITITSGSSGTGNGTVNYSVSANSGTSPRTGRIIVNGQEHSVMQAGTGGGCTYELSLYENQVGPGNGSTNIFMDATSGCAWSAVSDSPSWLTTSSSGSGDGTINYSRTANTSTTPRVGRITAGGQVHTVTQIGVGGGGSVQYSSTIYAANEGGGDVTITVTRTGGTASGSVQYATSDGTATAGVDYVSASGFLLFAENVTSRTFTVTILDDTAFEGNETFNLSLNTPSTSFTLGNPSTTTLTINDNEVAPPGVPVFDFDGDGKTDVSVYRPSLGYWYISNSSNGGFRADAFGTSGDRITPGDYDGDDKTDVAVWRPSNGYWYRLDSSNGAFRASLFGQNGDIPAPADFDGDGKTDICVFRPSNGTFYLLYSSDGSFRFRQWGQAGDAPVVGDYDGDGKADFAVFRPSIGTFYILQSSNGLVRGQQFGQNGDRAFAGDFDADGKADIAVYRPSTGAWYAMRSSDNGFIGIGWGTTGDVPAGGDYDGDRKLDVAVFRPSSGTFYILQSTNNSLRAVQFGSSGDVPVPSAYVP